jgi:hypothetical protein
VKKAGWSVFVATVILGINTAIVTFLNERQLLATFVWGFAAFLIPFVACFLIMSRLKRTKAAQKAEELPK